MPFETFSNELNHALGGGFGYGMSMIVGDRGSGKTTMAIDMVMRHLRQPDSLRVVVVAAFLDAWQKPLELSGGKLMLASTVARTKGVARDLTIAEVLPQTNGRGEYYIGERPFALAEVVHPDSATIFLCPRVVGSVRTYNAVVELAVFNQIYTAKLLKNRVGSNDIQFNITRREILEEDGADSTSLDAILGDEFDDIE